MRFDSQFARMNCQIFSCGLSSGARSGRSGRGAARLGGGRSDGVCRLQVPPLALLGRAARCWCPGCARAAAGSYAFPGRLVGLSALKTNAAATPPSSSART